MHKKFLVVIVAIVFAIPAIAQSDTTTKYLNKNGRETTPDSAVSVMKIFKQSGMWRGMEYYSKTNVLKSEGDYNEASLQTAVGGVNYYKEDGKLDYTIDYADGKAMSKTYFHKNGERKSYTVYSDKGIETQMGWDENGKELKNFIVERQAQFKGGEEAWKRYLQKNLNETIPEALGLPAGNYEVQVQFTLNKDGVPTNIKALSVPPKCKACGTEALRVMKESPAWETAILNNEPVFYETVKTISFKPVSK